MKFPKLLYPSFLCLLMAGCDMIDYHPYDVHISGETDVNAHNIAQIEQNCQNKPAVLQKNGSVLFAGSREGSSA
jgi:hypothetical protein